jgi:transcriptional regulator with XRE-family HTH domain
MTNNEWLRETMKEHELTQAKVAAMIGVSVRTVDGWCRKPSAKGWAKMMDRHRSHLKLILSG